MDELANIAMTKWWILKGDTIEVFKKRTIKDGTWKEEVDTNNMWEKIATCIWKVVLEVEVCGATKGNRDQAKDTLWWNEKVQRAIKENKECYEHLCHDKSVDNIAKKTTK
jgi:hypothetical protein